MFSILHAMPTPTRLLRATADALPGRSNTLSERQRARQEDILAVGLGIMVQHGRVALTMGRFAAAARMSASTIRRHFVDLDSILAELLSRHLLDVFTALGRVPEDAPNRKAALRAAYLKTTRNGFGAHTAAHTLLLRERHTLPPDLAAPLEQIVTSLGEILAGPHAEAAMALLDRPGLKTQDIEAMLACLDAKPTQTRPAIPPPLRPKPAKPDPRPDIAHLMSASRQDLLATAASSRIPWPKSASP